MGYKAGDVCRVNEEYLFSTEESEVVGSIVQVLKTMSAVNGHLHPRVYVQVLFSPVLSNDRQYVFYEHELDLIT